MFPVKLSRAVPALFVSSFLCCSVFAQHYVQKNLVSDIAAMASTKDSNLVNPWGISRSSGSPWWVSDNGTGLSTLYDGTGAVKALVVTIPAAVKGQTGSPTGTIYNGSPDFVLQAGSPAVFLFCTEDGTISGWSPKVNPTSAVIMVNAKDGSSYKGLASAMVGGKRYLYAANFTKGRIDIFDTNFKRVSLKGDKGDMGGKWDKGDKGEKEDGEEQFSDDHLPQGFSPYNVQVIGENLYVAYAQRQASGKDANSGPGLGFVDVYTTSGNLVSRLKGGEHMNQPWGITLAPSDFGRFSHDILVGQFGSGQIAAFNAVSGAFEGLLVDATGKSIVIPGLWGLSFGNNVGAGSSTALFFAAGINDEANGLFGMLTPDPTELTAGNGQ